MLAVVRLIPARLVVCINCQIWVGLARGISPMKEHKGQDTTIWRIFPWFDWFLTGIFTDRLNLFLPRQASAVRFLNILQCVTLMHMASVT
ncbi:hypothetical protein AJ88_37935 [Mesorhizobium amorphae CCBAU 01583]|nr:hypothetical protein AJ88_37935 [Mesorhizobium amorphae CCBAU 01583]